MFTQIITILLLLFGLLLQFQLAFASEPAVAISLDPNFEISCRELGDDLAKNLRFEVDMREVPKDVRCYWPFKRAARTVRIFQLSQNQRVEVGSVSMCRAEILADRALWYSEYDSGFRLIVEGTPKLKIQNSVFTAGSVEYRLNGKRIQSSLICQRN